MFMEDRINSPLVSIIIVNYNGIKFVESCVRSVLDTEYDNFEVIFIDNASSDGSLSAVRGKFSFDKRLKIIENSQSLGPVKARNIGIKCSSGKYAAFLDNDTEVDRKWLDALVAEFEADDTIGGAQSKLLLSDKKTFDSCGHYLSIIGFPYEVGVGQIDSGQYNRLVSIFGAKSAAMFTRRKALEKAGYFDEDYFMHSEETDLSWRLWLNGYRIIYVPQSVVYHKKGGSSDGSASRNLMFYEGAKNCTKTLAKNLGIKRLLLILPLHVAAWLGMGVIFLMKGSISDAKAIIKGLLWNLSNIGHVAKDRKIVQSKRLVTDGQIAFVMMGRQSTSLLFRKGIDWIKRIMPS